MNTYTTTNYASRKSSFSARTKALLLSIALVVIAGCGGGGGGSAPTGVDTTPTSPSNSYTVTSDGYGLEKATYLSSSKSDLGIVFRAAIATSLTDPDYKTVTRIDINPGASVTPQVVYSLASGGADPAFPGSVYFLNGQPSTLIRTIGGTISFTRYGSNAGDRVSGSYNAVIEDDNNPAKPTYTVAASFDFVIGSYGPAPAP